MNKKRKTKRNESSPENSVLPNTTNRDWCFKKNQIEIPEVKKKKKTEVKILIEGLRKDCKFYQTWR
jgi:hypothetical protein